MIGQRIGVYRVLRLLGRGGMGDVYEVVHTQIGRRAALKLLHSDHAKKPAIARRFLTEARAVNLIAHPGVVSIHEFGRDRSGCPFIVMEYLAGKSLGERIKERGALPIAMCLRLGRQIASVLAAAHEQNVVHRDLKPDNVMLIEDPEIEEGERVKVLDFGLAKILQEVNRSPLQDMDDTQHKTAAGLIMGTPAYMAPEQARDVRGATDRADVYSLGVMLYQMLTGKLPFGGGAPAEVLARHLMETPRPPKEHRGEIPEGLSGLILSMLEKNPDKRLTMHEVERKLTELGAKAPHERSVASYILEEGVLDEGESDLGAFGALRARAQRGLYLALYASWGIVGALIVVLLTLNLRGPAPRGQPEGRPPPPPVLRPEVIPLPRTPEPPKEQEPQVLQDQSERLIHLQIRTDPPGAQVALQQEGKFVQQPGRTPFRAEWPMRKAEVAVLRLRLKGHKDRIVKIDLGKDHSETYTLDVDPYHINRDSP